MASAHIRHRCCFPQVDWIRLMLDVHTITAAAAAAAAGSGALI
jgi:hypothetical protein